MRILFILTFLLVGCASQKAARKPASEHTVLNFGLVDQARSSVQVFPSVAEDQSLRYYIFVQLKDHEGKFIDTGIDDIEISSKGKRLHFEYDRFLTGRYYLLIDKMVDLSSTKLSVFVQGKPLKTQFKLHMREPERTHSNLQLLSNENNRLTFRLKLADKKNRRVDVPEAPEIIIDGDSDVENLVQIEEGVWEFSVLYPDYNQIFYISVRAMSVTFNRMYRYQHVEK